MTAGRVVLFVEASGQPALPHAAALQTAAHGARIISLSHCEPALKALTATDAECKLSNLVAIVSNTADSDLFRAARLHHPTCSTVLLTAKPMHIYAESLGGEDTALIDHVIAQTSEAWTIEELRVTLQKLLRSDYFGIEKHLSPETPIITRKITTSRDRDTCDQEVQKWAESCGLGKNTARLAYGITEELVMNAVFDAPIAGGRTQYETLERTTARDLLPDEHATLRYGCDNHLLAISIEDPFGAFQRDKWWQYARKILKRHDTESLIDTKKGGAGLGLFKMLYSSHGVVCNVDPGKRTEVIVLIDLTQPIRDFSQMPRSIHYFNSQMRP